MLVTTMAMAAAILATEAGSEEQRFEGRCQYPDHVVEQRAGTVLALCDSLEMSRDGAFDFRDEPNGSMILYEGERDGDRMIVSHLTLRTGRRLEASGQCEVFRRNQRVSVVACLARAGPAFYAANFVRNRLD